jgi:XTP/dITP diphosphohydrolase
VKLLLASNNEGKCREIAAVLAGSDREFLTLHDFPEIPAAPEEGANYEENALHKARHYAALTGVPALADDSGLEIEYLGGKPGVRSARFGGETSSYREKNEAILALLADVPAEKRRARFVCVVAYVDARGDGYVVRAECEGRIAEAIRGSHGFGYDPIFIPDGFDRTFGELSADVKNRISHRAQALMKARAFFAKNGSAAVCRIVRTDPADPSPEVTADAAAAILAGKLIAYPTDTLYGLGANALDAASARRVIELKRRPLGKPISVIVGSVDQARSVARNRDGLWERLTEAFWPGPLTIVVEAAEDVPALLTGDTGTVGVRVPDCAVARAICDRAEVPLTATSANRAGDPPPATAAEIVACLGTELSLVVDCGTLSATAGSTVVDISSGRLTIIRNGVIAADRIREVLGGEPIEDVS